MWIIDNTIGSFVGDCAIIIKKILMKIPLQINIRHTFFEGCSLGSLINYSPLTTINKIVSDVTVSSLYTETRVSVDKKIVSNHNNNLISICDFRIPTVEIYTTLTNNKYFMQYNLSDIDRLENTKQEKSIIG